MHRPPRAGWVGPLTHPAERNRPIMIPCKDCTITDDEGKAPGCPHNLAVSYIAAYWEALQGGCFVTHGMLTNCRLHQQRVDSCPHHAPKPPRDPDGLELAGHPAGLPEWQPQIPYQPDAWK